MNDLIEEQRSALKDAYLSVDNQSYSCPVDGNVDLSRMFIELPKSDTFENDDGFILINIGNILKHIKPSILDVLEQTQGYHGDVKLTVSGKALLATFSDGTEVVASRDRFIVTLWEALERGVRNA